MKEIFYYTGLVFWIVVVLCVIVVGYSFLPPKVKNFPADLWLVVRMPFVSNKKAQWFYNGLIKSSDIIKNRWAYKPCMWILRRKV